MCAARTKRNDNCGAELLHFAELDRAEERQALLRLFHGVERQRRMVLGGAGLVVELGVFFLQVSGVGQQDAAEIDGCGRGIDRPVEALLDQPRDPAGVIEMSVREDDGIDLARWNRQVLPVALTPFLLTLEQSAIDQHLHAYLAALVAGVDQVFRSGNDSGRAKKLDVAQRSSWVRARFYRKPRRGPRPRSEWQ